jgi:maltose O-acetyltransferase
LLIKRLIAIGEDVWVGRSVVICSGVTIGNRCIIGAGGVVTKDIADDVLATGNPCKIIPGIK